VQPDGLGFSQFKLRLSEWQKTSGRGLSMRQVHHASETVQGRLRWRHGRGDGRRCGARGADYRGLPAGFGADLRRGQLVTGDGRLAWRACLIDESSYQIKVVRQRQFASPNGSVPTASGRGLDRPQVAITVSLR
jgi:hypothetical protein